MDIEAVIAKASEQLGAGRSYGPVIERDSCTVLPAAWVIAVGGGGGGGDHAPVERPGGGSGGGGGVVTVSWPVGAYVIREGQVEWIPALDTTRLAVTAIAIVGAFVKLRSRRHKHG